MYKALISVGRYRPDDIIPSDVLTAERAADLVERGCIEPISVPEPEQPKRTTRRKTED